MPADGTRGVMEALIGAPFGHLRLRWDGTGLAWVEFREGPCPGAAPPRGPLADAAAAVRRYLADPLAPLAHLPLAPAGTPFQNRVWAELRGIPPGSTRTYGDVADRLGSSPRAVGGACRANRVPLVVPCHRVLAMGGAGGFAGATSGFPMAVKRWLLAHESGVAGHSR